MYLPSSYAMTGYYYDDSSIGVSRAPTMLNNIRPKPYRAAWRPTLDEVLNNTTPPPYTLSAFIQYLSQNHCLETLEFILEAKHYCESYKSLFEPAGESIVTSNSSTIIHLSMLYQLLLTTFILPGRPVRSTYLSTYVIPYYDTKICRHHPCPRLLNPP